jgi:two-component system, LytTR family, sensor histidine kinase AlgZ
VYAFASRQAILMQGPFSDKSPIMIHASPPEKAKSVPDEQFFLPSFCDVRIVFAVIVITELLAFVLVLASPDLLGDPWSSLGLISLLMQWIALTSAAVLCLARPYLYRLGNRVAGVASYLLVLLVTAAVVEMAFRLMAASPLVISVDPGEHAVFLLRSLTISTVIAAVILRYLYVQYQWRQQLRAEARARIQALQARIRPHFLFNSMNTIAALTRSQPALAETAIEDLAELFRASLGQADDRTTIGDELALARRYLDIEVLRLGNRLSVVWDIAALPSDVKVAPLMLQPLLENAIYHGIEPLPAGGTIRVTGRMNEGMVEITITNPVPDGGSFVPHRGSQIAQENIRQRLLLAFGVTARLETSVQDGKYWVTLRYPGGRLS